MLVQIRFVHSQLCFFPHFLRWFRSCAIRAPVVVFELQLVFNLSDRLVLKKLETGEFMSTFSDLIHDIKENLRGEPHKIEEIRDELVKTHPEDADLYNLIRDHHDYLKESISILMDVEADVGKKKIHLNRFLTLLDMHTVAEEETLYEELKDNLDKTARIEALSAQREHDVAKELAAELRSLQLSQTWSEELDAKSKVIASLVMHHIDEEEGDLFEVAKNDITPQVAADLGLKYLDRCKTLLTDALEIPVEPVLEETMIITTEIEDDDLRRQA